MVGHTQCSSMGSVQNICAQAFYFDELIYLDIQLVGY
jgi:hypothetical protein